MAEYIDREKALEDFEQCNADNSKWTPGRVKTLLVRQHSVEAKPVVYGQWLLNDDLTFDGEQTYVCSACHKAVTTKRKAPYLNYCFHCGTKMDQEA